MRWDCLFIETIDQLHVFQLTESLCKHFLRDALNAPHKLSVTHSLFAKRINNQHCPFVRDSMEQCPRRTRNIKNIWFGTQFHK